MAGLIHQEKLNGFERLLFRATRGNMFLRQASVGSVKDPATGEQQEKHVFVVFYAGERARTKILKVCPVGKSLVKWLQEGGILVSCRVPVMLHARMEAAECGWLKCLPSLA